MLIRELLDLKQGTEIENLDLPNNRYEFIYFDHVKNIGFILVGVKVQQVNQEYLLNLSIVN